MHGNHCNFFFASLLQFFGESPGFAGLVRLAGVSKAWHSIAKQTIRNSGHSVSLQTGPEYKGYYRPCWIVSLWFLIDFVFTHHLPPPPSSAQSLTSRFPPWAIHPPLSLPLTYVTLHTDLRSLTSHQRLQPSPTLIAVHPTYAGLARFPLPSPCLASPCLRPSTPKAFTALWPYLPHLSVPSVRPLLLFSAERRLVLANPRT